MLDSADALKQATREWLLGIRDPEPGSDEDENDFYSISLFLEDGFDWGPSTRYRGDGTYAWCGAFAAWCYRHETKTETRRRFASTWRLSQYGKENPKRCIATSAILPGDIVCVGDGDYGSHITLAMAWDARQSELVCVGGNQEGRLPDGAWGEGVTVKTYPRSAIKAAYRPLSGD